MKNYVFWFVTGSQHLYGEETLKEVAGNSQKIVEFFNASDDITYEIVWKPTVKTPDEITQLCIAANADSTCAGIITWMHTFSPSKMWINGLKQLNKPMLHLNTQFNRDIPWDTIDMDFMNTNQSAHGDREHGFIATRMGIARKVIAGHYQDAKTVKRIGKWMTIAAVAFLGRELKVLRFDDNMREVAVTEGDKVEAQIKLGWSINSYGIGDLVERMDQVTGEEVAALMEVYKEAYTIDEKVLADPKLYEAVAYQAKIEIAMKALLEEGGFGAFTDSFQVLHGMKQLPGLATQRMMEAGYGFGGEGDWKTAALTRVMKLMANNKNTSFMEDYTYHFEPENEMILGAHMLEVCPTIAADKPKIEVHPLGIGDREAPARLVFNGKPGAAVCASLIDMGGRFRLIILEVEAVELPHEMPKLPVASVIWKPQPSMSVSAEAWIYAGGAHHTVFSYEVTTEDLIDWADMMGIEYVVIDKNTTITQFKKELQLSEVLWKFK
jgi:L-arabinose isomerase